MAFLYRVLMVIVVSLVLAFSFRFVGLGWPMGVTFGVMMILLLIPVAAHYMTSGRAATATEPAVEPMISPGAFWPVVVIGYLLLAFAFWPVFQAAIYSTQPLTLTAMGKLIVRNDVATAMYLTPLDTGVLVFTKEQREAVAAEVTKDFNARIAELNAKRPSSNDIAKFSNWTTQVQEAIRVKDAQLAIINRDWTLTGAAEAKAAADRSFLDSVAASLGGFPLWLQLLIVFLVATVLLNLLLTFITNKNAQAALRAAMFAAVLILGFYLYQKSGGFQEVTFAGAAPRQGVIPMPEPTRNSFELNVKRLNIEQPWIRTGLVLEKDEEIVESFMFSTHNRGQTPCGPEGCLLRQLDGKLMFEAYPHMALLGRVRMADGTYGPAFNIGDAVRIDTLTYGKGELEVTVNQNVIRLPDGYRADNHWREMEGGGRIILR